MPKPLKSGELQLLANRVADLAMASPAGGKAYFRDLVERSNWPLPWKRQVSDIWTGSADYDARRLIRFAEDKGTNPNVPQWTALGGLLKVPLDYEECGLETASTLASFVAAHDLVVDPAEAAAFRRRYLVPQVIGEHGAADEGPDFDWRGPVDGLELQGWLASEPPLFDVGFLSKAIRRSLSVCRICVAPTGNRPLPRYATGVVIAPGLVMTNYHVVKAAPTEDLEETARQITFEFRRFGIAEDTSKSTFAVHGAKPLVASSATLDFALLRAEDRLATDASIEVSPLHDGDIRVGGGLHLLQHPLGLDMRLAVSINGVTGIYKNAGVFQYVTNCAKGSSGAPCFDDDWNVVGLHHAQRTKAFGRVGEGILAVKIASEIREWIKEQTQ